MGEAVVFTTQDNSWYGSKRTRIHLTRRINARAPRHNLVTNLPMKTTLGLTLAVLASLAAVGSAKAVVINVDVNDRPYYIHGPGYYVGPRYYVWVPGHWGWRHHHRAWIHGYYVVR